MVDPIRRVPAGEDVACEEDVQLACGRNSMRNLTDLVMIIPVTSKISIHRAESVRESPLISSTRHLRTPHPSASSRMTLAPKLSSNLIHSARDEAQLSSEIRVKTWCIRSDFLRMRGKYLQLASMRTSWKTSFASSLTMGRRVEVKEDGSNTASQSVIVTHPALSLGRDQEEQLWISTLENRPPLTLRFPFGIRLGRCNRLSYLLSG